MLPAMDEDTITDLKQFITGTVRQEITAVESRLDAKIDSLEVKLEAKIDLTKDEIISAVAEVMQDHIDSEDERLADHEKRLVRLEHTPA